MGIFSKLVGTPDVGSVIEKTGNALDKLFTSKDEKLTHGEVMERIKQNPGEWQAKANEISASHRSVFVAGARPAIMWVCAFGLAFVFVINPVVQWTTGQPGPELPTDSITEMVYALLGLGALRTFEKVSGAAK
jgi:hypothetical protein